MKRAVVIGCPGSGKSTFARALAEATGLPLYYLDRLYWNADRTTVSAAVFLERLRQAMEGEAWILDGNYQSTMTMRLEACDTVFFLDYPVELCLAGIRARRGKARADLPWVEEAGREDPDFEAFVRGYRDVNRGEVLEMLGRLTHREIWVFRSREEAAQYLAGRKCPGRVPEQPPISAERGRRT